MKRYSMIHGLLAAALAVNLALPVTAAGTSSFTDVSDSNTALNADILRLMGVVSGTGGNQFNPNQVLTRAPVLHHGGQFYGSGGPGRPPLYPHHFHRCDLQALGQGLCKSGRLHHDRRGCGREHGR